MSAHCGYCGTRLGATATSTFSFPVLNQKAVKTGKDQSEGQAELAYKVFKALVDKFEPEAPTLRLGLSTTSKLGGKDNAFALPAGPAFACVGATKACEACYAQFGRFVSPSAAPRYAKNWVRWRYLERTDPSGKTAANELIPLIRRRMRSPHVQAFRVWESGDFHSQWSVNVWRQIIESLPEVVFWGYTRAFRFDYDALSRLPNFKLWASTDRYNLDRAREFVGRYGGRILHAYGPWDISAPLPPNSIACPATAPTGVFYKPEAKTIRAKHAIGVTYKMPLEGQAEEGWAPGACGTCRYCLPVMAAGKYTPKRGHTAAVVFIDHDQGKMGALAKAYAKARQPRQASADFEQAPSPEFVQALQMARDELNAELNRMRAARGIRPIRFTKGLGAFSAFTDPVSAGLTEGCQYSQGRDDYFPG